jgi:hypothetical protein
MAPALAFVMVIEFATEVCVVDPLDAVVEVLGEGVDEVAVEVGEDPVLDGVVEVLGCGARVPVTVTVRDSVAVTYPGADAVIIIACVPGMMMLFQLVCRSPKGSV